MDKPRIRHTRVKAETGEPFKLPIVCQLGRWMVTPAPHKPDKYVVVLAEKIVILNPDVALHPGWSLRAANYFMHEIASTLGKRWDWSRGVPPKNGNPIIRAWLHAFALTKGDDHVREEEA